MLEYDDGTFSPIMDAEEALKQTFEKMPTGKVKALHFGTESQLKEVREKVDLKKQVEELAAHVKKLQFKHLGFLHIPTAREVDKLNHKKLTL